MKIISTITVSLPFDLDFCAMGPDVPPIMCVVDQVNVSISFPPSMAEGTDGQCFFPSGWAWWKGRSLLLEAALEPIPAEMDHAHADLEAVRTKLEHAAGEALRRLLNSYRRRFERPDVHAIRIDPKAFETVVLYGDGRMEQLPEPASHYFFNALPSEPPLTTSVNSTTVGLLIEDLDGDEQGSADEQLALDADWLDSVGERARARRLRHLLEAGTGNQV